MHPKSFGSYYFNFQIMIFFEMAPYLITYFVFKCEKIYRGQKVAANQRLYDSPLCGLCLHKQCHLFFIALDKTHNTQNSNTHLLKA